MPLPPLPDTAIHLGARASDWREVVRITGAALQQAHITRPSYTQRMIDVIDEYGAYVVIAPGLALLHARPGPDVLSDGMSVVTLASPVPFGHPHNDPVRVAIGLAVRSPDDHVNGVAGLANVFNDSRSIEALTTATSADEVARIFDVERDEVER
jgi:ascorbate PTS system EIIA or EIIAB component